MLQGAAGTPVRSAKPILPLYFGPSDGPLFGCYHEPPAGHRRKCAVLICQPVGHEYVNCHRALRQLAVRLAEAGFPVLRFDYYGCGDSAGVSEEGGISRWLEDISTAILDLRQRTGLAQTCVVGLRLGGALSTIIGSQRGDVESLVLWDPVVNGKSYLEKLLSLQKEMLRFRPKPKRKQAQDHIDVLGFPLSRFLRSELEKIDLLTVAEKPAKNILLIQSDEADDQCSLHGRLSRTEARLESQRLEAPQIWLPTADGSLLVPSQVLQSVVAWVGKTHS